AAGVDVSDWGFYARGEKYAAVNPKYCYDWAFIQPERLVVLSLWFNDMKELNGHIVQEMNLRDVASRYGRVSGKGVWGTRALKMDHAIRTAYENGLPVRVIICDGKKRDADPQRAESSKVKARVLDPVHWAVTSYNNQTGDCTITRGAVAGPYVDQFSFP